MPIISHSSSGHVLYIIHVFSCRVRYDLQKTLSNTDDISKAIVSVTDSNKQSSYKANEKAPRKYPSRKEISTSEITTDAEPEKYTSVEDKITSQELSSTEPER